MATISKSEKVSILNFVDTFVPGPSKAVWLAGSRAKGNAHLKSDWDVVAFSPQVSSDPNKLFESNQTAEIAPGMKVELVIAHPDHWNDPRQYMADLREFGVRLR